MLYSRESLQDQELQRHVVSSRLIGMNMALKSKADEPGKHGKTLQSKETVLQNGLCTRAKCSVEPRTRLKAEE